MNSSEQIWLCLPFDQLTPLQLYNILQLRANVFVVEQNCAYLDPDNHDIHPKCLHLFKQDNNKEVHAYCRILPPGIAFNGVTIGRVVVGSHHRGERLGKSLMLSAIAMCQKEWPRRSIEISAQCQWLSFYSNLGFLPLGNQYLEDGIPHQHMLLTS